MEANGLTACWPPACQTICMPTKRWQARGNLMTINLKDISVSWNRHLGGWECSVLIPSAPGTPFAWMETKTYIDYTKTEAKRLMLAFARDIEANG